MLLLLPLTSRRQIRITSWRLQLLRREFSYSNYQQCYTLPEDADREKISAKVADGILEVEIPKLTPKEEAKTTKNIEVK